MNSDFYKYLDICLLEDKLPHAFLIESNNVNDLNNDIISYLYKNKVINHDDSINNMNLQLIDSDTGIIKTESINNLQNRFSTIPINHKYNIYIIKHAEDLNISASNKILKFLEEPNESIIGFLLVENNKSVLPTIKSRCQIFRCNYDEKQIIVENDLELLFKLLIDHNSIDSEIAFKNICKKLERNVLITSLNYILSKIDENNYFVNNKGLNILYPNLVYLISDLLKLLKSNVNIDLVLDKLFIELRKIDGNMRDSI